MKYLSRHRRPSGSQIQVEHERILPYLAQVKKAVKASQVELDLQIIRGRDISSPEESTSQVESDCELNDLLWTDFWDEYIPTEKSFMEYLDKLGQKTIK